MKGVGPEWLVPATEVPAWTDAICRMVELSQAERDRLGARAAEVAQRFSPATNIGAVQGLYSELLARKGHAAPPASASYQESRA
jgi:hypothetical protein